MTLEKAVEQAKIEAKKNGCNIAVVNAPIEVDDSDGPFGYCPVDGKRILYPYGETELIIQPNGEQWEDEIDRLAIQFEFVNPNGKKDKPFWSTGVST